jgi:hypothetical protein
MFCFDLRLNCSRYVLLTQAYHRVLSVAAGVIGYCMA